MNRQRVKENIIMIADSIEKDAIEKAYCYQVWRKLSSIFLDSPYDFWFNKNITTKEKMAEHKIKYAMHIEFMKIIKESFEERIK